VSSCAQLVCIPTFISVPNLKRIAIRSKFIRGPKMLKLGRMTQSKSICRTGASSYVCTIFEADSSICSQVIKGSQNIEIGSRDHGHSHLGGHFVVHMQEGSVFHLCTEFEVDSSIHSKVIRGSQNFEIGSHDRSHAHLWVILWFICRCGPSSISVAILKRIALFIHKLIRGTPT